MTLPPSNCELSSVSQESAAFGLLDERIQRWIWEQQWSELRDIQEKAIQPVLEAKTDLIIASPTASGKTEAAFLPILSRILKEPNEESIQVLYISPLKALINDQLSRLELLCEFLRIPVWRWHGDVSQSHKNSLLKHPSGVLLITPESLESLFVNHGTRLLHLFNGTCYIVIDELHSFAGTERGSQLQSLLHRLELTVKRQIPRIGLSATLGEISKARHFLRHNTDFPCFFIEGGQGQQEIKVQVRGYLEPQEAVEKTDDSAALDHTSCIFQIAQDLHRALRGQTNLVFANRRTDVEVYADTLRRLSEESSLPNEFYPHHGSLSKGLREEVESIVKDKSRPSTVVCTATLELGIDIGLVNSVAQIGPPPSVSSLRQRLGRSGRRGQPAVLRMYVSEDEITASSPPQDRLRNELVQAIAMLELLVKGWYEPPRHKSLHLSTLVHQTLALIAQYGGIRAPTAWEILCGSGPFANVDKETFANMLRGLGSQDIIMQDSEGLLLLGSSGERIVNRYDFYAVFVTPEEYQLVTQDGRLLGTLPIDFPVTPGFFLIFAGKRWEVVGVETERRIVVLAPSTGGRPPKFGGSGRSIHDFVRREMFSIYRSNVVPPYLNPTAAFLLAEGRKNFQLMELKRKRILQVGAGVLIFPWHGDLVMNTLALQMLSDGFRVIPEGLALEVSGTTEEAMSEYFRKLPDRKLKTPHELASLVKNKICEKFDPFLSDELLVLSYASGSIAVAETSEAISEIVTTHARSDRHH
jgi:ATP-dependent Lhr-like helicase